MKAIAAIITDMSGQVNLEVSILAVILYSMNFLLTPTSSAAIKNENLIDIPG